MPNIELLETVLKKIEDDPAHWDQGAWLHRDSECGTSACFAGWAVLLGAPSYKPYFDNSNLSESSCVISPSGRLTYVARLARRLLGLDEESADILFSPYNNFVHLTTLVALIKEHGKLTLEIVRTI